MDINTVRILGFTNLDSSLEGGFFDSPKKVVHTCPKVDPSITTSLQVLHFLIDLLVTGNVHLEVAVLEFPLVLEGSKLLFELSGTALVKPGPRKVSMSFLYSAQTLRVFQNSLIQVLVEVFCMMILSSA